MQYALIALAVFILALLFIIVMIGNARERHVSVEIKFRDGHSLDELIKIDGTMRSLGYGEPVISDGRVVYSRKESDKKNVKE